MLKTLKPRLVELGKIKIGKKEDAARTSQSGKSWRAPEKLDHFLITTLERDARGDLKNDDGLMAQLAEDHSSPDGKLREIPIAVQSDEIEEILLANWVWYDGKRAVARCDGQNCTWLRDRNGNAIQKTVPCDGEHEKLDDKGNRRFKPHGTFHCVIASGGARWGGVYKFRTTSQITIEQLYGCLVHLKSLTGGVLQGLPLSLVVRPMQVAPQGKATTVYVVHVELRGNNLQEVQAQALQLAQYRVAHHRQIAASQAEFRKLLRAPGVDEDDGEQEDVAAEFTGMPPDAEAPAAELPPAASHVEERARELVAELGGRVSAGGGMVIVDEDAELDAQRRKEEAEEAAFNAQSAKSMEHYAAGLKNKADAEAIAARAADLRRSADQTLAKQKRAAAQTVSVPAPAASKANGSQPPSAIDADSLPF